MPETRFPAMGTLAHVVVAGPARALAAARDRIADLESRWSRFLPDSEISVLNRSGGARVSPETEHLVATAIAAWRRTGGRFDPTVHAAMVRNGYAEPYPGPGPDRGDPERAPAPGCTGIEVGAGSVRLPAGVGFDPGGIGKGLAADLVAEELVASGVEGALVNIGGDLRAIGHGPGGGWAVTIDEPLADTRVVVGFEEGGLATSTPRRRRWTAGGREMHHLVDPATGLPLPDGAPALVTVVAAEAWWAEACTKAAMVMPTPACGVLLEEAAAMIVQADGTRTMVNGMERYLA